MSYTWMMLAGVIVGAAIGTILLLTVFRTRTRTRTGKRITKTNGRDDLGQAA